MLGQTVVLTGPLWEICYGISNTLFNFKRAVIDGDPEENSI
jgi:hypothetical protein